MKIIAFIPARAGSKGVPGKNKAIYYKYPLYKHALNVAKEVKLFTDIILSTNDHDILQENFDDPRFSISKRDDSLSTDRASIVSVVIDYLQSSLSCTETLSAVVVLLQPTSPIRFPFEIEKIIHLLLESSQSSSVFTVAESQDIVPARMYRSQDFIDVNIFKPECLDSVNEFKMRQAMAPVYYRTGAIYAVRAASLLREKSFITLESMAYLQSHDLRLNIDTPADALVAPLLIQKWYHQIDWSISHIL